MQTEEKILEEFKLFKNDPSNAHEDYSYIMMSFFITKLREVQHEVDSLKDSFKPQEREFCKDRPNQNVYNSVFKNRLQNLVNAILVRDEKIKKWREKFNTVTHENNKLRRANEGMKKALRHKNFEEERKKSDEILSGFKGFVGMFNPKNKNDE